jgi:hypothetical protein
MSYELEYAVKKGIRNNAVLRQADARQRADLRRMLGFAVLVVAMLLVSAWQHNGWLDASLQVEQRRVELEAAQENNRKLRLNLATRLAPETLARHAERLGLRAPTLRETIVIERIHQPSDASSIVASAR